MCSNHKCVFFCFNILGMCYGRLLSELQGLPCFNQSFGRSAQRIRGVPPLQCIVADPRRTVITLERPQLLGAVQMRPVYLEMLSSYSKPDRVSAFSMPIFPFLSFWVFENISVLHSLSTSSGINSPRTTLKRNSTSIYTPNKLHALFLFKERDVDIVGRWYSLF